MDWDWKNPSLVFFIVSLTGKLIKDGTRKEEKVYIELPDLISSPIAAPFLKL